MTEYESVIGNPVLSDREPFLVHFAVISKMRYSKIYIQLNFSLISVSSVSVKNRTYHYYLPLNTKKVMQNSCTKSHFRFSARFGLPVPCRREALSPGTVSGNIICDLPAAAVTIGTY